MVRFAALMEESGQRRLDRRQVAEQRLIDDLVEIGRRGVGYDRLDVLGGDGGFSPRIEHQLGDFPARRLTVGADERDERRARVRRDRKPGRAGLRIDEGFESICVVGIAFDRRADG